MQSLTRKDGIIAVFALVFLVLLPVLWYLLSPLWRTVELHESSPILTGQETAIEGEKRENDVPVVLTQSVFTRGAHDVEGQALLIRNPDGTFIVRFEDFQTTNGPDVRIYLSSSLSNDDYVSLGSLRATVGSVNYNVPAGTDIKKYHNVLVWCEDFQVLFSYAVLDLDTLE